MYDCCFGIGSFDCFVREFEQIQIGTVIAALKLSGTASAAVGFIGNLPAFDGIAIASDKFFQIGAVFGQMGGKRFVMCRQMQIGRCENRQDRDSCLPGIAKEAVGFLEIPFAGLGLVGDPIVVAAAPQAAGGAH